MASTLEVLDSAIQNVRLDEEGFTAVGVLGALEQFAERRVAVDGLTSDDARLCAECLRDIRSKKLSVEDFAEALSRAFVDEEDSSVPQVVLAAARVCTGFGKLGL